ncbi:hypothetical protein ACSVH6_13375, partial [Flavobacterium sp. XGLA_31]
MNKITFLHKILLVAIMLISFQGFTQNLLINGGFEAGGSGVGFQTNYFLPATPGTSVPREYSVITDPFTMNTANFVHTTDHTTGAGKMMVVDGSGNGNDKIWELLNGSTIGVVSGQTYFFSYWIKSISATNTLANSAIIAINTNGTTTAPVLISGSATCPVGSPSAWTKVTYSWTATTSNAQIWMTDTQTAGGGAGNDFALDDIELVAAPLPLTLSYSYTNPTCYNSTNGTITAYANNGTQPYVIYNLTGASTASNTSGVFTGLAAGTYSISVTDTAGTTVGQTNIVLVAPAGLTTGPDTIICAGNTITLTANGGSTGYTWTASPADPSLTTPTSSNPTVSPSQTTVYTVTSNSITSVNLVTNGNFSGGNVGFDSDYNYYTPNNPSLLQKAYGIVTNPSTWETGFSASCVDHTSGTGQMMVVDGSTTNSGNDMVWGQNIPVSAAQTYTFTFWAQSLTSSNPASIRVVINGVVVGILNLPATTCTWTQFPPLNWNSGASTTAQIQLFDNNTNSGGNDFAIDDIQFSSNVLCNLSKSVTITVSPLLAPTISCGAATSSSVSFTWPAVTGATNYAITYSINNGAIINGGNTSGTSFSLNSLSVNDSVKIFVMPSGAGCFASGNQTCIASLPCVVPAYTVTQPTCAVPTGSIVFTSPVNPAPLPVPSDLFISEVTDEDVGSLTYVEIFNGTGVTKNLANYRLKVYNNGNATASCDLLLSGSLANNSVVVVAVGSNTNQGGVTPNLTFAACGGVNIDDNIRLATVGNVEFDLWGRTDGVAFTPTNAPGYSYRRLAGAAHPSMTWNPADWTALDPQDYTNVGSYQYVTANYQYSVNAGASYQASPSFNGLAAGNYTLQIRDLVSGCISTPIAVTLNPMVVPNPPSASPVTYCQNAAASPLTATPSAGGTLNWYGTNATGGTASATAPTPSTTTLGTTTYYVSQTVGGCESTRTAIVVSIANTAPTGTPQLFCDDANSTPTSVAFDFNNVGQTSFTFSYSIDGGAPVTGSLVSPSHYVVPGVTQGQSVTFTLTWNGVCTPSQTVTCYPTCVTPVNPTFNPVAAICSGGALSPLPTTSTNGITGTWSPALNNTATTTYTFTPNAGECANTKQLTITVNPNVTPTFTAVAPICSGGTLAALPTTSNNGITGTWSPALNNTATTTYTFTPTAGQCATTTTLTITVNPNVTPTFTQVAPICQGQTLAALPTTSNNGFTGTWAPALDNTVTTTYTFTPTAGQCATTTTMTITVNGNTITPIFAGSGGTICTGAVMSPLPTTSLNSITGTWSPALNNTATTTYTFTPTVGQCATTATMTVTVNGNTIVPVFTAVAPICTGGVLSALPTTSNDGINGSWSPALNNTATTTYTFTPTTGQCALTTTMQIVVNPNVTPTFTAVAPICSGGTLSALPTTSNNGINGSWSPALNNMATTTYTFTPTPGQCATTTTLTIVVNSNATPTFTAAAPVCSGAVMTPLPTTSNNSFTGTWSPALNNTATTTYTFTPTAGQCATTTTMQIEVVPSVTPTASIVESCNSNSVTVTNPLGANYQYSLDGGPFQASPFFLNVTAGNHSLIANQTVANCNSNVLNFTVNAVVNDLVVTTPAPLQFCDPNNDGFINVNLNQAINSITGGNPYIVSFHETLTDANVDGTSIPTPANYFTINPWSQIIYVRVESTTTDCFEVVQLQIIANPTPEA